MCRLYRMPFTKYMHAGKNWLDYTHSISSKDYKKNDKIIYKYFNDKCGNISYIYILYITIYIYIYNLELKK